jgi:translation initiation factor 2 subunit 1
MQFYREKLPKKGDYVYCVTAEVMTDACYLELLEYSNIRGIIIAREASRKIIHAMSRMFSVGRKIVAEVINVDPERGYVDLSKKHVGEAETTACEDKYHTALAAHKMISRVIEVVELDEAKAFSEWGWDLDYAMLHAMAKDSEAAGWKILPEECHTAMKRVLSAKFQSRPVVVKTVLDVCLPTEGVEGIKAIFSEFKADIGLADVKCRVVSCPRYLVTVETLDHAMVVEAMTDAVTKMAAKVEAYPNSLFSVVESPQAVIQEEFNINSLLEKAAPAGRSDSSDEDDEWEDEEVE